MLNPEIARIIPNWTEERIMFWASSPNEDDKKNKLPSLIPHPPIEIGRVENKREIGKIRPILNSSNVLKPLFLHTKINSSIEIKWLKKDNV